MRTRVAVVSIVAVVLAVGVHLAAQTEPQFRVPRGCGTAHVGTPRRGSSHHWSAAKDPTIPSAVNMNVSTPEPCGADVLEGQPRP